MIKIGVSAIATVFPIDLTQGAAGAFDYVNQIAAINQNPAAHPCRDPGEPTDPGAPAPEAVTGTGRTHPARQGQD